MYDYRDRVNKIREIMKSKGIDYYLIPLSDYHNSEYFDDYYNVIKFVSGFTGSNATMVISAENAYLWTDGRYFIQAESELKGSGIELMKQGLKSTPSVEKFLQDNMDEDEVLAFDGRLVNVANYEKYMRAPGKNRRLFDADIVSKIRNISDGFTYSRPWILKEEYAGESTISKLLRIRGHENFDKADALLISDLCDIAWTLNLRGSDIEHMPVFYSYLIITNSDAILYSDAPMVSDVREYLDEQQITLKSYDDIYDDLSDRHFYTKNNIYKMLIDKNTCNTALYSLLNEHTKVLQSRSVVGSLKCIKNDTQINNIRKCHIKDGVAVTKFLYHLDMQLEEGCTELKLAELLHKLRAKQEGFLDESFDTISAWAEHGAIVHYEPTKASDAAITRDNFLLVDSGGHYLEGTTDITRTMCIGMPTPKMIYDYTLVLKSNIALARAVFLDGTGGKSLDILTRNVMWQEGYDFLHGTGHGVGYLLSVHEGPNNISIRAKEDVAIKPGMVTTDEPGIYIEGEYGIRLENELLCVPHSSGDTGDFYSFECLTLAPFQAKCIDINMLSSEEIEYLNNYHSRVYDIISPYLDDDEAEWLQEATRELSI